MEQEELERNRNSVAAAAAVVVSSDTSVTRSQVPKTGQLVRRTVLQNGRQVSVEEREEPASDDSAAARQLPKRSRLSQIPSPFGIVEEPVTRPNDSDRPADDSRDDKAEGHSVEITDVTDEYDAQIGSQDQVDQVSLPAVDKAQSSPVDEVVEIHEILDDVLPESSVDQEPSDGILAAPVVEVTEQTVVQEILVRQTSLMHETLHEEVEEEPDESSTPAPVPSAVEADVDWNILPEVDRHFDECFAGELNDLPVASEDDERPSSCTSSGSSTSTDTTNLGSASNSIDEIESIQPPSAIPQHQEETLAEKLSQNVLEDALKAVEDLTEVPSQPEVPEEPVIVIIKEEVQVIEPIIEIIPQIVESKPLEIEQVDDIPVTPEATDQIEPEPIKNEVIEEVVEQEMIQSIPKEESSQSSESEEEQTVQLGEKVVDILPEIVHQLIQVEQSMEVESQEKEEPKKMDSMEQHRGSVAPTLGENTPGPPPSPGDERALLEHVARLVVSTAHPATIEDAAEEGEQTAQQAELNIQWQEIQSLLANRLDHLRQDASSSTHSSSVRYLATVTQVTVEETVEERIVKLQDNLAALRTAVQSREVVVIQRIVITIVRTVTEWLETIEYRVYTIKQTKSMERRTEQIQSLSEQVRVVEESLHTVS